MASGQTKVYGLNQWQAEDQVLREEFNADNAKVDQALAQLTQIKGNCQIIMGSYIGTGTYGESHANTLVFERPPAIVFVVGDRSCFMLQGNPTADITYATTGSTLTLTWSGSGVAWHCGSGAYEQMNVKEKVYHYAALFPAQ